MDIPKKYSGLRFLAFVIKIVAWVALILSIVAAVWFWMQGKKMAGLQFGGQNWTGVFLLPLGLYTFIQLYIIGSLISLFADVEYNTRANATATARLISLMDKMEKRLTKSAPSVVATPPPPPPPPPAIKETTPAAVTREQVTTPEPTRPVRIVQEHVPPPPPPPEEVVEAVETVKDKASSLSSKAKSLADDVDSALTE